MVWPTTTVTTTNLDAATDNPSRARSDLNSLIIKTNEIILTRPQIFLHGGRWGPVYLSFKALTQNMWLGVGPTGSGASVIFPGLNNLPVDAYAIICYVRVYGTLVANAWARRYSDPAGPAEMQRIFSMDTTNDSPMTLMSGHLIIPVLERRFDINQNHGTFDSISDYYMSLIGYIV